MARTPGKSIFEQADEELAARENDYAARGRYPALRAIAGAFIFWSWLHWILGVLVLMSGVGAALYFFGRYPLPAGAGALGALFLFGAEAAIALVLRARGEEIYLQIDMEKNTRDTVEHLARITRK